MHRKGGRRPNAAPTLADCYGLTNAAKFASTIGLTLNAFLTIWWKGFPKYDGTDASADRLQRGCFEDLFGRLDREGIRRAAVWVRERKNGRGLHTHMLLNIGEAPARMRDDLLLYLPSKYGITALDTFTILLGSHDLGYRWPAQWAERLRYAIKATRYGGENIGDQSLGSFLGVPDKGSQGFMTIKRAGTTEGIGPAERARAGWDDISTPDALKAALHPPSAAELKALGYVATPTGCALMRRAA